MGAKDSKRACLSYEDAVKRVSDAELHRVCEAFKRLASGGNVIGKEAFTYDVLGECVPAAVAEWLYTACGGTPRGIALRDLICGLVLLTRGTQEEKIKFLWTLYSNESGSYITKSDFNKAIKLEQSLRQDGDTNSSNGSSPTSCSLFNQGQDKVTFDTFRMWVTINKDGTGLSRWLLLEPCVSLSSEMEMPTFYQTLAGVTHLEEHDISELEKCFWALQTGSVSDQLDLACVSPLVSPPIPQSVCSGLFLALDENRDGHIDFKELCCGVSAACRGPMAERMKFCFKVFDVDRDGKLNSKEIHHMAEVLELVTRESKNGTVAITVDEIIESLQSKIVNDALSQEDFLIWSVCPTCPSQHFLELLFEVCHVALGLRPQCRHYEHDIVTRWLEREQRRGYCVGQFWYLISATWWKSWMTYTTSRTDTCNCRPDEEGIACDESFTSNSTESMGDLLGRGETLSIASSSGVSSSSGSGNKKPSPPGPINNSSLVAESLHKVGTLTGEGGRLKRDLTLAQHRDFELVPDSLWKALALWYGGPLPLPRQVIRPPGSNEVDLELYPLNLRILRHQIGAHTGSISNGSTHNWSGYGSAIGLSAAAAAAVPRRYLAHTAAFSRLACVRQVAEFLSQRLALRIEDIRLWHVPSSEQLILLEDENVTLQELGICDDDQLLLEVRNKDLTWPEELGALCTGGQERRVTASPPPGATGLHNLGNTCFMNAALQAVSNTQPLNQYFRKDIQLCELNCTNPLGTRGLLARRYGELCRELWAGNTRSVAPLKLRWCVTKHAPHLSGGGQHDSQELLAWLLDGLHEDLNRVAVSPYTELKDSDGRPDCEVAKEAWDQHLARNKSIIIDLFHGQLKSKVTCQTCGHESVRFDPFSMLSLPLPMESFTLCEILVIRLDASVPIKYGLRLNSESTYGEIKKQLQPMCGINPEYLILAEVSNSQLKYVIEDSSKLRNANILELFAYEAPTKHVLLPDVTNVTSTQPLPRDLQSDADVMTNGGTLSDNEAEQIISNQETANNTAESTNNNTNPTNNSRSNSIQMCETSTKQAQHSFVPAIHRKMVRQEAYFLSQHKCKPIIFGVPLLLGYSRNETTCQELYEAVWAQVTRLLSPLPQTDQTNHATDCDDSLGYEFPFTLCIVATKYEGRWCGICPWNKFCRGCRLPCRSAIVSEICNNRPLFGVCIAIDWDQTALHLRYQSSRERQWVEDESVRLCRIKHTEPIDLDHCLRAFTSEERLEAKYHCSSCKSLQPATKKLQIWKLPPILVIHLKRFDCVNGKWVKTQKVVNFPFVDFDPTEYLASVPQETILRHRELNTQTKPRTPGVRERLESTSLRRTPVDDEDLQDFHQHHLKEGQDPFDLKYKLYSVVSHSGMLNGGHYICYACNPNGAWYCYNDSSCREVARADSSEVVKTKFQCMDTSSAYILFYERSGLDYTPYFPDTSNGVVIQEIDSDDGDSDPRKNCVLS